MARSHQRGQKKPNATGRNEHSDRFARLPHNILISEAYRSLDLVARCLLFELIMMENGRNNGSLWLSVRDATDRLGTVDARPAIRAFEDLQDRGLIAMTHDSHFSIKAAETSRARCWRITWQAYDRKCPSNDWKAYIAPAKTKARKAADRGLKAMARYRKALSENKLPVVDFTAMAPKTPYSADGTGVNSPSACSKNDANAPNAIAVKSTAHIAATMGAGAALWPIPQSASEFS